MFNGIYQTFIKNNTITMYSKNLDNLKKINISNPLNCKFGIPETVTQYEYLTHLLTLPFFSDEKKNTIRDILHIPKKERYINWAEKHIPKPENLTENQISRITTVVQESFHLAKIMKNAFPQQIQDYEEKYSNKSNAIEIVENDFHQNSLLLSGGAIRDILFLPETNLKDLDFCFAFTKSTFNSPSLVSHIHPLTIFSLMENNNIDRDHQNNSEYKEQLQKIQSEISYIQDPEKRKTILSNFEFSFFVRHSIAKHGKATDVIFAGLTDEATSNEMGWAEYINYNLAATVKTVSQTGLPIDILISSMNNLKLIKSFDFCLCKSFLDLNKILDTFNDTPEEEQCIEYFYNNLFVPITVLRDIAAKELSISSEYLSNPEKIDFFIDKHYKRLLLKYHNFDLNIEGSIGDHNALENTMILKNKLDMKNILSNTTQDFVSSIAEFKI